VDGEQVATLSLVDFPKPYQLQKIGSAMFMPSGQGMTEKSAIGTQVRQGALEESNVQALMEMVNLIATTRLNESCTKTIQSYDEMANKAANELGRV
jgi:flagellar basal-body rod protein FlgG